MTFTRSRSMRLTVLAATVALTAGALGTSAVVAQDEELDGTGVKIDLIVKEKINPFWVWMIDGATARAEELGADLQACWGAFDPDPEGQTTCIENAVARGATTILLAPSNAGVVPAVERAREEGVVVIALDTATDPADAVDITFATDNFQAGLLIGQWAAAKMGDDAANAKIGLINIDPSQPVVGVQRNQGFLQGFGIDIGDPNKWGDETDPRIVGQEVGSGSQQNSVTAMENLLQIDPEINLLYTINEPTARGAVQAMNSFGISTDDVLIVSVDGGCEAMGDIDEGIINATSQQYPSRMAELGVEWGIRNALTDEVPAPEDSEFYIEGNEIFNTGVTLITNDPQEGVDSITAEEGRAICWGTP
ncbi:MAG: substrate-binding domain-containing protein [Candidatus Limnocylindrales bacterium]